MCCYECISENCPLSIQFIFIYDCLNNKNVNRDKTGSVYIVESETE